MMNCAFHVMLWIVCNMDDDIHTYRNGRSINVSQTNSYIQCDNLVREMMGNKHQTSHQP